MDIGKNEVLRDLKDMRDVSTETLFEHMETYLGTSAKFLWETYKRDYPARHQELLALGANPHNFLNVNAQFWIGQDANYGMFERQKAAMLKLEQMQLTDYNYINDFLAQYANYAAIATDGFKKETKEKLFNKLPGPIGQRVRDAWLERPDVIANLDLDPPYTIPIICKHVMNVLAGLYNKVSSHRQLTKTDYEFCCNISTPGVPQLRANRFERK